MRFSTRMLQNAVLAFASLILACAIAFPVQATESTNPEETEMAILNCGCEQLILPEEWMNRSDLNGDGLDGFVFIYAVVCDGFRSMYCGSAGCQTRVWYGVEPGKWILALSHNTQKIEKTDFEGQMALKIFEHGVFCGRTGSDGCESIRIWDGEALQTVWSDY